MVVLCGMGFFSDTNGLRQIVLRFRDMDFFSFVGSGAWFITMMGASATPILLCFHAVFWLSKYLMGAFHPRIRWYGNKSREHSDL